MLYLETLESHVETKSCAFQHDPFFFTAASEPKEKWSSHPTRYPSGLDREQTIRVEDDSTIRIHFSDFFLTGCNWERSFVRNCDYVNITDEDGTFLANIEEPKFWTAQWMCNWEAVDICFLSSLKILAALSTNLPYSDHLRYINHYVKDSYSPFNLTVLPCETWKAKF